MQLLILLDLDLNFVLFHLHVFSSFLPSPPNSRLLLDYLDTFYYFILSIGFLDLPQIRLIRECPQSEKGHLQKPYILYHI